MAKITISPIVQNSMSTAAQGPLKGLYSVQNLSILKYPLELETDMTKMHYVKFTIFDVIPASYQNTTSTNSNPVTSSQPGLGLNLSPEGKAQVNQLIETGTNKLNELAAQAGITLPTPSPAIQKAGSNLKEMILNGTIPLSPTIQKTNTVISLYMPDTVNQNYQQTYSEFDLQDNLGKILNTIRTITHVADTGLRNSSGTKADTAKAISTDPAVIKAAVNIAGGKLGIGNDLGTALLQGQGYAVNPAVQMIYKGLPLREFTLSFTFTPKSKQESDEVNMIIHKLKYYSLPRLESASQAAINNMFLIPPSIFQVQFYYNGTENTYLPKYDYCVLRDIDVNDAPNGWSAHMDGSPVQRQLSLRFAEMSILHRDKLTESPDSASYR